MSDFILDWAAAAEAGSAQAGGKGWQLGLMAQLGVPVPQGFVIAAGASVQHRLGLAMSAEMRTALMYELEVRGWSHLPLAVRSSAPLEDSARASFAGIHLSRLNVQGPEATVMAVQEVWDSLWTPQAQAYRQRFGFDDPQPSMAVVVMPLLAAVASGIAFTCDPLTGRDDQVLIHANWGLGEALVSGKVDGDEYRLQTRYADEGLSLLEQRLGSKALATVPLAQGGVESRAVSTDQAVLPVLAPDQVLALGKLLRDAAGALDYTGTAYDLEWVWDGARFWIVQARPLTVQTRLSYPELVSQPVYWSRGNTREILPTPLSPLDWGLSRTMVSRMLTLGYELSGYALLPGAQRAGLFHGRLYLQTSLMQWEGYDALGVPPKALNQLLGGHQGEITVLPPSWGDRWARGWRMLRYLRRSVGLRRQADNALSQARQRAATWMAQDLPADNAVLAQLLRSQFAVVHGADELFFLQGSSGGTLSKLVEVVEKYCPGEGHALVAALMAGGAPSITATQGYELMELARIAEGDASALAWLRDQDRISADWSTVLPEDSPWRQAFSGFLQRYGHRGIYESYLRNPRWREAPAYLLDSVVNLIGTDRERLRKKQEQMAADAWRRVRRDIPFWLRPLVKKLVQVSRVESKHREAARSALVAYLEVLRRGAYELSQRFHGSGGWEHRDDIFNLTEPELFALAEGHLAPAVAAHRAARRRAQINAWARELEPEVLVEQRQHVRTSAKPVSHSNDGKDGEWLGTAVGSGSARGRVRIARSPAEGLAMMDGEVLVASSTDPAWTPLFLKAGALVMETGGYLSHGAIVAREFGIPAVVNVQGILDQLKDGEQVEVDGNAGWVRRL